MIRIMIIGAQQSTRQAVHSLQGRPVRPTCTQSSCHSLTQHSRTSQVGCTAKACKILLNASDPAAHARLEQHMLQLKQQLHKQSNLDRKQQTPEKARSLLVRVQLKTLRTFRTGQTASYLAARMHASSLHNAAQSGQLPNGSLLRSA